MLDPSQEYRCRRCAEQKRHKFFNGNGGQNVLLFNGRFELSNDLFGFGEQVVPRFRTFLSYQFVNRLWLIGGVDNIFVPGLRDYFVGLQLRFTDDDLKTILPFAPGVK